MKRWSISQQASRICRVVQLRIVQKLKAVVGTPKMCFRLHGLFDQFVKNKKLVSMISTAIYFSPFSIDHTLYYTNTHIIPIHIFFGYNITSPDRSIVDKYILFGIFHKNSFSCSLINFRFFSK